MARETCGFAALSTVLPLLAVVLVMTAAAGTAAALLVTAWTDGGPAAVCGGVTVKEQTRLAPRLPEGGQ